MYDIIVNENTTHITDSFFLPFQYGTVTIREYILQNNKYTEDEAIRLAKTRLEAYLNKLMEGGVYIYRNNVTIDITNNTCIAQGVILVEEPAWEYKIIDESEWRINQRDEHIGDNN
jgi:similar to stage IV sporulation protein